MDFALQKHEKTNSQIPLCGRMLWCDWSARVLDWEWKVSVEGYGFYKRAPGIPSHEKIFVPTIRRCGLLGCLPARPPELCSCRSSSSSATPPQAYVWVCASKRPGNKQAPSFLCAPCDRSTLLFASSFGRSSWWRWRWGQRGDSTNERSMRAGSTPDSARGLASAVLVPKEKRRGVWIDIIVFNAAAAAWVLRRNLIWVPVLLLVDGEVAY